MHREAVPDLTAELYTIEIGEGLAAVSIQVIHYQVNGFRRRVLTGQLEGSSTEAPPLPRQAPPTDEPVCVRINDVGKAEVVYYAPVVPGGVAAMRHKGATAPIYGGGSEGGRRRRRLLNAELNGSGTILVQA